MKLFTLAATLLIPLGLTACDQPVSKSGSAPPSEKPNVAPSTPPTSTPAPSDPAKDLPKTTDPVTPPPARP